MNRIPGPILQSVLPEVLARPLPEILRQARGTYVPTGYDPRELRVLAQTHDTLTCLLKDPR